MTSFPKQVTSPRSGLATVPSIYWSCQKGGQQQFRLCDYNCHCQPHERKRLPYINQFYLALTNAVDHIRIIDNFYLNEGIELLKIALASSMVNEIRILTSKSRKADITTARQALLGIRNKTIHGRNPAKLIEIRGHLKKKKPDIHDRFAIVDDELWHFGGTVGGVNSAINAASGPWSARQTRAIEFFEEIWIRGR